MAFIRKTSDQFSEGQNVKVIDPKGFISEYEKYLTGRTGVVTNVYPKERPNPQYCGHTNKVQVLWGRRNGRGKEKSMMMDPSDLEVVIDSAEAKQ